MKGVSARTWLNMVSLKLMFWLFVINSSCTILHCSHKCGRVDVHGNVDAVHPRGALLLQHHHQHDQPAVQRVLAQDAGAQDFHSGRIWQPIYQGDILGASSDDVHKNVRFLIPSAMSTFGTDLYYETFPRPPLPTDADIISRGGHNLNSFPFSSSYHSS